MDEAVDAAEVDEHAERRDRADGAGDLLAHLEAAEQLVPLLAALLVEGDLLGQDEPVGLAVDLEDLEPELAADERLELLGDLLGRVARLVVLRPAREVDDLADRHEAADAAVDDEAALVVVDDRGLDDEAGLELLLHRAPLALEAGAAQGQDDVALLRLGLEDVDEDDVADVEGRRRLGVATVELAVRDDAFALGADVDEDLVLVDADDVAFDDVAVAEALDVGVLLGEELLHRRRLGAGPDGGRLGLGGGRRVLGVLGGQDGDGGVGGPAAGAAAGFGAADVGATAGVAAAGGATGGGIGRRGGERRAGPARPERRRRPGRARGGARRAHGRRARRRRARAGDGAADGGGRAERRRGSPGRRARRRRCGGTRGRGGRRARGVGRLVRGGLVGDGQCRDGLLGRLVGGGGDRPRLRRGPARVVFGQGIVTPARVVDPDVRTARALPEPSGRSSGPSFLGRGPILHDQSREGVFICPPQGPGESSTRAVVATISGHARTARPDDRRGGLPRGARRAADHARRGTRPARRPGHAGRARGARRAARRARSPGGASS